MKAAVRGRTIAILALVAVVMGCAGPVNPTLKGETYDPKGGYRYDNVRPAAEDDELFLILAFSGGGTRAAAFSYGVLEGLRTVEYQPATGAPRKLLEAVNVISSVSGGSFTAAHYALFGTDGFKRFEDNFLYRDIQGELIARAAAPWNWARLARSDFSRIDIAAELYDEVVFEGATFATLLAQRRRPYLILNATDMTRGARFEFTQDQFDLLCSDLSPVPVARGVAASSAFPILLSPLTLHNYSGKQCPTMPPDWLSRGLLPGNPPRTVTVARDFWSYRAQVATRPYVHLLDGGLSDNIGLRGPYAALAGLVSPWNVQAKIGQGIRHVVVITANAKTARDPDWDKRESPPGIIDVLGLVTTGPMGNYSFETVQLLADYFKNLTTEIQGALACKRRAQAVCPAFELPAVPPAVDFHAVELAFDGIADDAALHRCLEGLSTSFYLPAAQVTLLRQVARHLLMKSEDFRAAMKVIAPGWQASDVPISSTLVGEACPKP